MAPRQPFSPIFRTNCATNRASTHSTAFVSSTVERYSLIQRGTVVGNPAADNRPLRVVAALAPRSTDGPTIAPSTVVDWQVAALLQAQ